ncbi:MAG: amino acid racemase [Crocinitomix sp.]|nr:amino acid racemase [Crocinitomix sp.]
MKIFSSQKKKLGVISGMGTRAGLCFINKLIENIDAPTDQDFPEFILHNNSSIPDRTLAIVYGKESPVFELTRSLKMMQDIDVDFVLSTCITSYHYLRQIDPSLTNKLLDPIKMLSEQLRLNFPGVKRVGVLATTGTMESGLFHKEFEQLPYELVTLNHFDQENKFMKSVYMEGGFKSAQIDDEAYELFNGAVDALKIQGVDLIIGGCTEVQIGMSKVLQDFEYLDTMDVLIKHLKGKMNLEKEVRDLAV